MRVLVGNFIHWNELPAVAGATFVVHYRIITVVNDEGRDWLFGASKVHLLVVGAGYGSKGGKFVRQVAANYCSHAAAVRESGGVDFVPVDEVVIINAGEDFFDKGEVFAGPAGGVGGGFPGAVEAFGVDDDGIVPGSSFFKVGGFDERVDGLIPSVEAEHDRDRTRVCWVIVFAYMEDIPAVNPIRGGEVNTFGFSWSHGGFRVGTVIVFDSRPRRFRCLGRRRVNVIGDVGDLGGGCPVEELPQGLCRFCAGNAQAAGRQKCHGT